MKERDMDNIKVTIQQLAEAAQALSWLGEQKLPADRILPLIRTRRVANEHLKKFTEDRNEAIKHFAGDAPAVPAALIAQCNAVIDPMLTELVEIPDPGLTWAMTEKLFTTANQLEALLWLIKDVPLG
jgi:hypothetical protein